MPLRIDLLRIAVAALALAAAGALAQAPERSGAQVARAHCALCHDGGLNDAPLTGDQNAWASLIARRGMDVLVRSVARGHGDMPPRGDKANLTDEELRAATLYMASSQAARAAADRRAGLEPPAASLEKAAGHLRILLSVTPAGALRSFPAGAAGRAARDLYLVNVVVLERNSNAPVAAAIVEARVEPQGPGAKPGEVLLVPIGAAGYGAYLRLDPRQRYALLVRVRPPGGAAQVEAKFDRVL